MGRKQQHFRHNIRMLKSSKKFKKMPKTEGGRWKDVKCQYLRNTYWFQCIYADAKAKIEKCCSNADLEGTQGFIQDTCILSVNVWLKRASVPFLYQVIREQVRFSKRDGGVIATLKPARLVLSRTQSMSIDSKSCVVTRKFWVQSKTRWSGV